MLTPKDLENPQRKSGFEHVNAIGDAAKGKPEWYRGSVWGSRVKGSARGGRQIWRGPARRTAEEAAQDYCDYINAQATLLTIEDIRNPQRKSGFDHVVFDSNAHRGSVSTVPYRAQAGARPRFPGDPNGNGWRGPRRATAEEAAQDYCDYINGQRVTAPAIQVWNPPVIDMGNTQDHAAPSDSGVKVVRDEYKGPHDLYDVLLISPNGDTICRKVGVTKAATRRYADICTTFGISIKPHVDAVTYPDKASSLAAERKRVAEVSQDTKNWRRVGKESFAPARKDSTP